MGCQHRGCRCSEATVKRGEKSFCSDRCAELETTGRHEAKCPCGHGGCGAPKTGGAER